MKKKDNNILLLDELDSDYREEYNNRKKNSKENNKNLKLKINLN